MALIRECREELGIFLEVDEIFGQITHTYPHGDIHLTLLNARILEGTPTLLEHNAMVWIRKKDIPNYIFCLGDVTFLEKLSLLP